jgi:hypothetical protein
MANYQVSMIERNAYKVKNETIIIQFNSLFINVTNSTANGQLQSQHKHNNKIRQHTTKQQSKKQENKNSKSAKAII